LGDKYVTLREKLKQDSIHEKQELEFQGSKYIMVYDFLLWKFRNTNKATIASYLIDIDSYQSQNMQKYAGRFMCTTSYLMDRIHVSKGTVLNALSELENEGYIVTKVKDGYRYVRINHSKFLDDRDAFIEYNMESTQEEIPDF